MYLPAGTMLRISSTQTIYSFVKELALPLVVVSTNVVLEMALSGEALVAAGDRAGIRLLSRVDPQVRLQVPLLSEGTMAAIVGALKGLLTSLQESQGDEYVGAGVDGETADSRVLLPTEGAGVRLLSRVRQYVALQVSLCDEAFAAAGILAGKGTFAGLCQGAIRLGRLYVNPDVRLQVPGLGKLLPTLLVWAGEEFSAVLRPRRYGLGVRLLLVSGRGRRGGRVSFEVLIHDMVITNTCL